MKSKVKRTKSEERNDFCKKKRLQDEDGDDYDLAVLNQIKRAALDEKRAMALATSELATTDFIWEEKCHSRILPIHLVFKVAFFFTFNEAEDRVICHSC